MPKFRMQYEFEAMQFTGENADEIQAWSGERMDRLHLWLSVGGWLVRDVHGNYCPYSEDDFDRYFGPVEASHD